MNKEKENIRENEGEKDQSGQQGQKQKTSAFGEPEQGNEKSTFNQEEADLEQARKEVMTERD
ncbi:MAG TPA: hypothetical protein VFR58_07835 [Flavisolibacter sp.]|nr:hypothetical protein [Flavisolibacter sp.]